LYVAAPRAPESAPDPKGTPFVEPEPSLDLDLDDIDTHAYLRQGRLLN